MKLEEVLGLYFMKSAPKTKSLKPLQTQKLSAHKMNESCTESLITHCKIETILPYLNIITFTKYPTKILLQKN